MSRTEEYRTALVAHSDWDSYLMQASGLPGPRANLELVQVAADLGDSPRFERWLTMDAAQAPANTPGEYLPLCGAVGLGRLLAEGKHKYLKPLRKAASDPRWRVREGVAMGLQRWGERDMDALLDAMETWSIGSFFEQRAVVAGLCEPKLLKARPQVKRVLEILDQITRALVNSPDPKSPAYIALKKALSYGWSVAVAADPVDGKHAMEKWLRAKNPIAQAIMRENLTKARLKRIDAAWVKTWSAPTS